MSTGGAVMAAGVFALAVGAAASGFVAVDSNTAAADKGEGHTREFISQRTLTCQPMRPVGDSRATSVAVAVPGVPGVVGAGVLRVGALGRKGLGAAEEEPGATVTLPASPRSVTPLIRAEGSSAPGLVAAAVSLDPAGEGKGLASSPCVAAGSDTWLLGGGAAEGQRDSLILSNPTTTGAVVDLSVFGRGGRFDVTGAEGVTVPAGTTRVVRLDVLAPGVSDAAVRVRTQVGIVAATIVDDRMDGLTPRGTDVILPVGRPAEQVLLPVPGGAGDRRVVLLSPWERAAVSITALGPDGAEDVYAGEKITVKPGHVTALAVSDRLAGRAAVLRIESDAGLLAAASAATDPGRAAAEAAAAEVAAAERAVTDAAGAARRRQAKARLARAETRNAVPSGEDLAWHSPAVPLGGTAAVTGLGSEADIELLLSAPAGDATATVSVLPAATEPARLRQVAQVTVRAGTTQVVPVPAPQGGDFYTAVITPGADSEPLVAAHVQRGAEGAITGYSLQSLPAWVALPDSRPEYGPS